MAERFVTVATYGTSPAAEIARGLLEAEGIRAFVIGGLTADVFPGGGAFGDQVALQVHERDAPRAVSLLAAAEAGATLDRDWEVQAEAGVWVCPVCGTAAGHELSACPACKTQREAIREGRTPADTDLKRPERGKPSEAIRPPRDRLTAEAPAVARTAGEEDETDLPAGGRAGCVVILVGLLYPLWLFVW
jgi:hypothetical protein